MRRTIGARCSAPAPVLSALALLFLLLAAPTGADARVEIGGGEAHLTLDRSLVRDLRGQGVVVKGIGPGKARGRVVELQVAAGATNGSPGRGALTIAGGFAFDAGRRSARVGDILVNTGKGQSVASIAGTHRILAKHGRLRSKAVGFDTRIRVSGLRLTRGTAAALNRRLGLRGVFRAGRPLGSLALEAVPKSVPIEFGSIAIGAPDTAFTKLESIGAQFGIWGSTQRWAAPGETYFLFDVAATELAPDASSGVLEGGANDGITIQIHAPPPRNMLLRGLRLNLGARDLTATVSALSTEGPETVQIATLDYSAARFQIRPRVGAFELTGIRAVASQFIAEQINKRFQAPGLIQAGDTLARVTVTLHG